MVVDIVISEIDQSKETFAFPIRTEWKNGSASLSLFFRDYKAPGQDVAKDGRKGARDLYSSHIDGIRETIFVQKDTIGHHSLVSLWIKRLESVRDAESHGTKLLYNAPFLDPVFQQP
ncbi:hypothetical protein TNCT_716181 [Trichonephila clavata]|uniref:Uncharacterized protein n=1 Tax=Trichonephila clavata TaxID=2740835 RepID=A0A8X6KYG5_TRICU|nr:hypothetical protein TNCT_716181 [Trichonephila clavata]